MFTSGRQGARDRSAGRRCYTRQDRTDGERDAVPQTFLGGSSIVPRAEAVDERWRAHAQLPCPGGKALTKTGAFVNDGATMPYEGWRAPRLGAVHSVRKLTLDRPRWRVRYGNSLSA
jgi:hypothetical protein